MNICRRTNPQCVIILNLPQKEATAQKKVPIILLRYGEKICVFFTSDLDWCDEIIRECVYVLSFLSVAEGGKGATCTFFPYRPVRNACVRTSDLKPLPDGGHLMHDRVN